LSLEREVCSDCAQVRMKVRFMKTERICISCFGNGGRLEEDNNYIGRAASEFSLPDHLSQGSVPSNMMNQGAQRQGPMIRNVELSPGKESFNHFGTTTSNDNHEEEKGIDRTQEKEVVPRFGLELIDGFVDNNTPPIAQEEETNGTSRISPKPMIPLLKLDAVQSLKQEDENIDIEMQEESSTKKDGSPISKEEWTTPVGCDLKREATFGTIPDTTDFSRCPTTLVTQTPSTSSHTIDTTYERCEKDNTKENTLLEIQSTSSLSSSKTVHVPEPYIKEEECDTSLLEIRSTTSQTSQMTPAETYTETESKSSVSSLEVPMPILETDW